MQCTEEESKTLPHGHYKINTGLIEKLKTQYKDYVLLWCALGAKKFIEDKHMNVPNDPELIVENMSYINACDSFNRFIGEHCVIAPEGKALKSVIWTTYKKFIEDEKIPKALTKGKLNEEFEKKFGKPVKNCIDYYYGVSIIERKQFEEKTEKTVSFQDRKAKVNYDEPREDNGLDDGLDM